MKYEKGMPSNPPFGLMVHPKSPQFFVGTNNELHIIPKVGYMRIKPRMAISSNPLMGNLKKREKFSLSIIHSLWTRQHPNRMKATRC